MPEAPSGLRIVPGSNQMELSWEAPVDDGGSSIRGYVVEWKSGDEDYDESRRTVIDDPSSNSHTVTGLTEGVEHTLRVTAFNVFGDGDYAAVTNLNRPATGAPPISGTARVGETLTASTSGIADEDGLSDPTYSYKWIRNDGTTDSVIRDTTYSTYTLNDDDAGKTIKVRVSFTDDGDNEETLTSDPTAVVAATVPGVPQHVRVTPHDSQALDVSWEAPTSDGGSAVTGYKVQWKKATGSWDTPEDVSEAVVTGVIHTIAGLTGGTAYSVRVLTSNEVGDGSASAELAGTPRDITPPSLSTATVNEAVMTLTYDEALDENSVPASETFSVTAEDAATTVDSVSVSGSSVTLTLSSAVTTDVAVTVSYAVPAGQTAARVKDLAGNPAPALSSQAVVNVTEQSGNDNPALWSATMTVGVSNGLYGYEYFYFRLGALSDRTITLDGSVYGLNSLGYYSSTGSLGVSLDRAITSAFLLRLDGFEFASDDASTLNGGIGYVYGWHKGDLNWSDGEEVNVSLVLVEKEEQAENTPPTGAPTITGTARVGEVLEVDTSGIADADGLGNVQYEYQWLADDTEIAGATGLTYTLTDSEESNTVKVQVFFTDDEGNSETLTSAATDAVDARPNSPATGAPTITGTAQVGQTLNAGTSGIADADGIANATFSYQWLADDTDITGAAGLTYTLTDSEESKAITVQVSFTDDAGNDESLTSAATEAVSAAPTPNSPATGAPTIGATAQVGETLTADTSGIADADGLSNVQYEYQWLADDAEIAGATGSAYTLVDDDEGKAIKVRVSFTDDAGNHETLTSEATDAAAAAQTNSPATGAPTISGTAQVGETLTADTSGIADADGLSNVQYEYQWIADDADISGATNATYTLAAEDEGKAIKVEVSFTDDADNEETLTSAGTDAAAAASTRNSPATGVPTISGTAQVGETLTADTSGIADADGMENAAVAFYWGTYDNATGQNLLRMIDSEGTYTIEPRDVGMTIHVHVTFEDDRGNVESTKSAPTDTVKAAPTINSLATGAPTISGTAQVGETLTANTSGIADADGLSSVQYEYQWLADDTDISGATNATYTLTDSEESKAITVQVSFTDDADNKETLTSAATDAVAAAPQTNSPATGAPTIAGTSQVGQTLTADTSGIADADGLANATFSYQWLADDTEIAGATGLTYTLIDSEESKAITVQVSFTDDRGHQETLTSAATEAVSAAPTPNSPATGAPAIGGTAQVGETLTANTSGIADADGLSNVQYEYQWFADDAEIAGATGLTYTLADADEGKAIKVEVSFTDDADNEESLTSAATAVVAAEPSEPPDKPKGLEATASHGQVVLTWDNPQDDSITGYVILRRVRENDEGGEFSELVADTGTAATTYTDAMVAASTTYTYRIKAINGVGTSERSRWVHIDTPAPPVPDKPTGLSATAAHDAITLTWDNPGDDSITGYVILRRVRENDTGGDFSVLVADTGSAATTYTDDTVAASTTYTYRIKAINEHGTSERSRWYHIDTPAAP